jgi:hypothetical protein
VLVVARASRETSMSDVQRSYPTVSHVFALAPEAAAVAFDVMLLDPAMASTLTPTEPVTRAAMNGYRPMRRVNATLQLPGRHRRTLPVTLELLPWSETWTELAIWCPSRPGIPLERNVAAYMAGGHRALQTLSALMGSRPATAHAPRRRRFLPVARDGRAIAVQD